MRKGDKYLLGVAIIGTLLILGMAFVDRWLFPGDLPPGISTATASAPAVDDSGTEPNAASDAPAFVIDAAQSDVRFSLGETLGGQPITVVGDSDIFSGTLYLSLDAPQEAQLGEILVNARDLETDNSFRNRALQSIILVTDAFPTISFMPTSINGLPESVAVGDSVDVEIVGNLTIKDVTREETFTVQVTLVSETQIDGHAETLVAYADYGIIIPSAPRVADVDDEVLLEMDFVALAE